MTNKLHSIKFYKIDTLQKKKKKKKKKKMYKTALGDSVMKYTDSCCLAECVCVWAGRLLFSLLFLLFCFSCFGRSVQEEKSNQVLVEALYLDKDDIKETRSDGMGGGGGGGGEGVEGACHRRRIRILGHNTKQMGYQKYDLVETIIMSVDQNGGLNQTQSRTFGQTTV